MARPCRLTTAQQAELRLAALEARADSPFRGRGATMGRAGRNATEVLIDLAHQRWGVEFSPRGMQKQLNRLGLEYLHLAQGGFWIEAAR
jgi:hypothetical protein